MFTPIARYEEFNAETFNLRLRQLEAVSEALKYPFELITSGTLATSQETINLELGAIGWRLLRLTGVLLYSGFNPGLRANNNTDPTYKNAFIQARPSGMVSDSSDPSPYPTLTQFFINVTPSTAFIDLWITLDDTGYRLLGRLTSGQTTPDITRFGSVYLGSAVTSLQITHLTLGGGSSYAAGSSYRLEGMRV